MTRGGKREGAGAPKGPRSGPRTRSRAVRLSVAELARWDALCAAMALSQADVLRAALTALEAAQRRWKGPSQDLPRPSQSKGDDDV